MRVRRATISNRMEDLTKQQLVLVTLLVSFVTSIATGIVTVSLLDQAPSGVTQTINQVVEKTIEKIVPVESKATVTKEVKEVRETVVVKGEEEVIEAVEEVSKSVVRIFTTGDDGVTDLFISLGVVISRDGAILTDRSNILDAGRYEGVFPDGTTLPMRVIARNDERKLAYLEPSEMAAIPSRYVPVSVPDNPFYRLGQTVFAIGGIESNKLSRGVVTGVPTSGGTQAFIETDISLTGEFVGAVLADTEGEVIGIRTRRAEVGARNAFLPLTSAAVKLLETERIPPSSKDEATTSPASATSTQI